MRMILSVIAVFLVVLLVGSPVWAGEAVLLNDEELDQVYAGQNENDLTNSDNNVVTQQGCITCTLTISGTQSATSAILVNAVGSIVNTQLNILVINDSTTGTINQLDVGFTTTGSIH